MPSGRPFSCSAIACPTKDGRTVRQLQLADAQRAMRLIRARAAEFKIDPTAWRSRLFCRRASRGRSGRFARRAGLCAVDAADSLSARPAFVGLIYPVITLDTAISHGDTAPNLLGPNPSPGLIATRSPALHVTKDTPPSFVAAAMDDGSILPENSLLWTQACRKAGVDSGSASLRGRRSRLWPASAKGHDRLPLARPIRALDAKARGLIRAFTRAVSPRLAECQLTHLLARPSTSPGQCAHAAYEQALAHAGFEWSACPSLPKIPTRVFVEDTALLLDGHAIITRPGVASRADETDPRLKDSPTISNCTGSTSGHLDGGDVLRIGRSSTSAYPANGRRVSVALGYRRPVRFRVVRADFANACT